MASSIYIHIPFCKSICSYCDFCKFIYNEKWTYAYLKALKNEINDRYMGEEIKTIYIGGGTPSALSIKEIKSLLSMLDIVNKNPKLMILNYFDVGFNSKYKRKIIKLIKFIKASLNINFIVISNDVNFMNKLVKHVIVCKNKIIKYQGSIINAIKEEYIEEPPIYNFVRLANERGANLEYTLDGKDLLKDIYRSVF